MFRKQNTSASGLFGTAKFILRLRGLLMVSLIALTGVMLYLALKVKLSYEGAKILPLSDSTYAEYLNFKKQFGEDGSVMVIGFEDSNLFKRDVFNDWTELSVTIKAMDGIQEVISSG